MVGDLGWSTFFGTDGQASLQYGRFVQFLRDLHDEILRLEFSNYDYNSRGDISAKDFALSLFASADINHINKMLDQVDELSNEPHLRDIRITFEEFKAFADLRKELQSFSLAIFSYGKNILFHIYKHNQNKYLIVDYILYINAIIMFLIFIIIINFHI
ncbi:calcium uptake protein, mitochondrial-like isoform X3 [Fagus crenata]